MTSLHFKHGLELLQFRFLFFNLRIVMRVDLTQQEPCNVQHFLQLFGMLQLQVTKLVASIFLKQVKKPTNKHLVLRRDQVLVINEQTSILLHIQRQPVSNKLQVS